MERDDFIKLAKHLLLKHGLSEWSVIIEMRPRARMGSCRYGKKQIGLSEFHLKDGVNEITNTLLHVIAHVLVGPGHNHDRVWTNTFRAIGGNGSRTAKTNNPPKPRYIGKCSVCGKEYRYYRKPKNIRRSCHCGGNKFSENHLIHISKVV